MPDVSRDEIERALDEVAAAAARAGVVTIVGTERPTPAGREIVAVVLDADGTPPRRAGEDADRTRARSRTTSPAAGVAPSRPAVRRSASPSATRRAATPRSAAPLVLDGAQVVFVPHYVTTEDGALPERWCDAVQPVQREGAHVPRAREHGLRRAVQHAGPDQGSATCIIDPDGSLVAQVPYGEVGVAVADVDLERADGLLARRWAPERNADG